jgi:hypothetical protein
VSAQTKTYYERPPATARAARRAWDHFLTKRGGSRGLKEVFYSPNYDFSGCPHWVCIVNMRETDTMHWNFSEDCLTWAEPAHNLANPL